jgi:serine protease Do
MRTTITSANPRAIHARAILIMLTLFAWLIPTQANAQALPREIRQKILKAVVQVIPLKDNGDPVGWSGSGTIISESGYILTNFHVVGDTDTRQIYKNHAILFTEFPDQPPVFKNIAQIVATDPTYDLAVIKINLDNKGNKIPSSTRFAAMPVGSSNDLIPGDPITMVGYPGISGSTITFTQGLMSGWLGEDFESGGKNWIKTDGKISHGNSGGAAFNERGELIGVPTAGRTRVNGTEREEQAYVRPIGLAWSTIGPNVPDVLKAQGTDPNAGGNTGGNTGGGGNSAGSSDLTWPPKITPGQIWTVQIEGLPAWKATFEKLDQDGDPTGSATQGSKQYVIFSLGLNGGGYRFQLADATGSYFCDFPGASSLSGQRLVKGKAFRSAKGSNDLQDLNKSCTATLGANGSNVTGGTGGNTGGNTGGSTGAALTWPPKVAPGQNWTVQIDGLPVWTLSYDKVDQDGDPTGTAKQGSKQFSTFAFLLDDGWFRFQISDNTGSYYCDFENASSLSGSRLVKGLAFRKDKNSENVQDLKKGCTATLLGGSNAAAGSGGGNTGGNSSSVALTWPPKVVPGQTWTVQIDGLPIWNLSFDKRDQDGDPTGTATQGSKQFATFAFLLDDGWFRFQISDNTGSYYCDFENASSLSGSRLVKGLAFRKDKNSENVQDLKKGCTAAWSNASGSSQPAGNLNMKLFKTLPEIIAASRR